MANVGCILYKMRTLVMPLHLTFLTIISLHLPPQANSRFVITYCKHRVKTKVHEKACLFCFPIAISCPIVDNSGTKNDLGKEGDGGCVVECSRCAEYGRTTKHGQATLTVQATAIDPYSSWSAPLVPSPSYPLTMSGQLRGVGHA